MGRHKIIEDEELLNHARRLFVSKGASISTKEIALSANISQATLFQRFPTKEALFRAAMIPPKPEVDSIIGAGAHCSDPQQALVEISGAILDYFRAMMPIAVQLMLHPVVTVQEMKGEFQRNNPAILIQGLAMYLNSLNQTGRAKINDQRASAGLLIAAIHSLALFELMGLHEELFLRETLAASVAALWSGMQV